MPSTRIVEEERGTYTGHFVHQHNGYYAGDFSTHQLPTARPLPPLPAISQSGRRIPA